MLQTMSSSPKGPETVARMYTRTKKQRTTHVAINVEIVSAMPPWSVSVVMKDRGPEFRSGSVGGGGPDISRMFELSLELSSR